jgi:hypothetical protein
MNHLDEGTIHAWLDGALDAEQSRATEAHVQSCRQCADAVAEARGLVAASSRILGALDDVPANVIPAHAPAVMKRRSMWRAAPWVTGIAAVLLAAVVLRTDDAPQVAEVLTSRPTAPVADTARSLAATSAAKAPVSAASAPTTPRVRVVQAPAAERPVAVAARGQVSGGVAGGASVGSAASSDLVGVTVTAADTRADEARKAQFAEEASLSRERSAREEVSRERAIAERSAKVAAAPAPPPSAGLVPQHSRLTDVAAMRARDPVRDSIAARDRFVGCYAISLEPRRGVMQELARRGAASDARRPAPVAAAAPAAQPASRLMVRLDSVQGRNGYVVRDASADTAIGWWSRAHLDSARMELQMLGVAAGVAGRDKISCPDR